MNWKHFLQNDWWQSRQIVELNEKLREARLEQVAEEAALGDEIAQLENDLGRALLLLHSLIETCVRKGVLTREEISAVARQIDLSDGVADGQLHPATMRPSHEKAPRRATTTLEFLRHLERQPIDSPKEFLRKLENSG